MLIIDIMRTEKITAENVDNVQLKSLYESAFPKEERIPYDELKGLLGVMPIDFMAYYDEDVFVGLTTGYRYRIAMADRLQQQGAALQKI